MRESHPYPHRVDSHPLNEESPSDGPYPPRVDCHPLNEESPNDGPYPHRVDGHPLSEESPSDGPYDAWVLAGGRLFRAHSSVLSAHSPYLRATLLATGETRILLPHIPAGGFSAVLAYMYTGRLSLSYAPLYEVMMTGHLLHMQMVVSLCQTLLSTPSFHPTLRSYAATDLSSVVLPPALHAWRNLAQLVPAAGMVAPLVQPTLVRPTPKRAAKRQDAFKDKEDTTESAREGRTRRAQFLQMGVGRFIFCSSNALATSSSTSSSSYKEDEKHPPSAASVVLDVAACDGPVFFERVLNKTFRANTDVDGGSDSEDSEINVVDTAMTGLDAYKHLANSQCLSSFAPVPNSSSSNSKTYHCVYCNNTFKSHYCYQKHTRRHINPITTEEDEGNERSQEEEEGEAGQEATPSSSSSVNPSSSSSVNARVLELNVQYFPCKTCGSKFPSYYFVHKHRRMCHKEEEDCGTTSSCDSLSSATTKEEKGILPTP